MLRWLPVRLRRLYERLVAARPHARARRVPPIPAAPPPSCGRDRKHRLDVVYDAFCERRPAPRHLFRPNYIPRDLRWWCDQPHPRTDKPRPRCPSCERARSLYLEAVGGNEDADRRLHHLARRGAVRLLAERRRYRAERAPMLAAQREQRAAERARYGPQPEPFEITLWPSYRPSGPGAHHARARRDVERDLVRDYAALLRVLLRRRCGRLRVLALACDRVGRTRGQRTVRRPQAAETTAESVPRVRPPSPVRPPAARKKRQAPAQPPKSGDVPAQPPAQPPPGDVPAQPAAQPAAQPRPAPPGSQPVVIKIGAARPTIPPPSPRPRTPPGHDAARSVSPSAAAGAGRPPVPAPLRDSRRTPTVIGSRSPGPEHMDGMHARDEHPVRFDLLTENPVYKPFRYPWAYEAWLTQQRVHWLPEEVPLADDVKDWHRNLSGAERNLLTQIFRFFTQADVEVNNCYMKHYSQVFKPTEVLMMLSAFSNIETVHIAAYSHLLDTIGMPEIEYQAFLRYKEMKDKFDYMQGFRVDSRREVAKTLAAFGAFTEGLQLFASFAILLNFPRFGKMKGMGQIISWSVRDETLHCVSIIRLFRTFVAENPEIWTEDLKREIYLTCATIVDHEDAFIELAFEQGPVEGLTAREVREYIRYIADRRLQQLGLNPLFQVAKNPLTWLDEMLNAVEHTNFFENRATEYSKAATVGTWEEAFDDPLPAPESSAVAT